MRVNIIDIGAPASFQPVTYSRNLIDCPVAGISLSTALTDRIRSCFANIKCDRNKTFNIRTDLWPSLGLIKKLLSAGGGAAVYTKLDNKEVPIAWISSTATELPNDVIKIGIDDVSLILRYSWDLLFVNESLISDLKKNRIEGTVSKGVNIDGNVVIGKETVLLPGVYIEGDAVIGENCKIGPNCYIRGKTYIGNNCHIGQAVEIKNSILMDKVSVGHLSYVGDSILGEKTNFGAGTITANLRHDGKNHRSEIDGIRVDTARRKLGVITGDDVHTGINTSIYPGRKLWPHTTTLPGAVIKQDIKYLKS